MVRFPVKAVKSGAVKIEQILLGVDLDGPIKTLLDRGREPISREGDLSDGVFLSVLGSRANSLHHRRFAVLTSPSTYNYSCTCELVQTETCIRSYYIKQLLINMQRNSKIAQC